MKIHWQTGWSYVLCLSRHSQILERNERQCKNIKTWIELLIFAFILLLDKFNRNVLKQCLSIFTENTQMSHCVTSSFCTQAKPNIVNNSYVRIMWVLSYQWTSQSSPRSYKINQQTKFWVSQPFVLWFKNATLPCKVCNFYRFSVQPFVKIKITCLNKSTFS